jgi:hypothetical protein
MNTQKSLVAAALLMFPVSLPASGPPDPSPPLGQDAGMVAAPVPEAADSKSRADRRYEEMLGKMQAAVEEIAQLYGNPVFLQVFTNDEERASELKARLHTAQAGDDVKRETAVLEKKRDDLLNDIALKEREATRLTNRLARQRLALDVLAAAVEQARRAVEETAK